MNRRFAVAGGGTGGHINPALALAEVLRDGGDEVQLIGTQRGLEGRMVPEAGFPLITLDSRPLVGRGLRERISALWALARATAAARRILKDTRTEFVLSVGGYAAVPVSLAARISGVPQALVEPNALPGFANRATSRFALRIFTAFDIAGERLTGRNGDPRVRRFGVPLRRKLLETLSAAPPGRMPEPPYRIFVFGGSQGAKQLNDNVPAALGRLSREAPENRLEVVHQTGEAQRDEVAAAYEGQQLAATVLAFERQMADRYRWCDVVVCRAGALTIAELALARRPALLIPLGHTGGGEQVENARAFEVAGAGRVLPASECSPEACYDSFAALFAERANWPAMGDRASKLANPRAAQEIVEECRALLEN